MRRQLLEELYRYFAAIKNRSEKEESLFLQIHGELPYFHITSVHRDDLESRGFDISNVSDGQMETIADKLAEAYTNQAFWIDLDIIAGYAGVPKKLDKKNLIAEIEATIEYYGAFSTADVAADASPCISNCGDTTVLAEWFCEDTVTAVTYRKGMELRSEFISYTDLEKEVLRAIYELCREWETRNE
jgi:hypothetical protein